MTAPVRTWNNPLLFRVEQSGIAVNKTANIVYVRSNSVWKQVSSINGRYNGAWK